MPTILTNKVMNIFVEVLNKNVGQIFLTFFFFNKTIIEAFLENRGHSFLDIE